MNIAYGGWKSIAGAIFVAAGSFCRALGDEDTAQSVEKIGELLQGLGLAVLGLGIADKIKKLKGTVKEEKSVK